MSLQRSTRDDIDRLVDWQLRKGRLRNEHSQLPPSEILAMLRRTADAVRRTVGVFRGWR